MINRLMANGNGNGDKKPAVSFTYQVEGLANGKTWVQLGTVIDHHVGVPFPVVVNTIMGEVFESLVSEGHECPFQITKLLVERHE